MIGSFISLGFGLVSAVAFMIVRDKEGSNLALSLKMLSSVLFFATFMFAASAGGFSDRVAMYVLAGFGFAFCIAGDFFLDFQVMRPDSRKLYLTIGMCLFAIAHVFFTTMLFVTGFANPAWWIFVAAPLTTVVALVGGTFLMGCDFKGYILVGSAYVTALLLTMFTALEMVVSRGTSVPLTFAVMFFVGAVLFAISDAILALTLFGGKKSKFMIVINHATYYGGLFLMAIAFLWALPAVL